MKFRYLFLLFILITGGLSYSFAEDAWMNVTVNGVASVLTVLTRIPFVTSGGIVTDCYVDTVTGNGTPTGPGTITNPINLTGVINYGDPVIVNVSEDIFNITVNDAHGQLRINVTAPSTNSSNSTWLGPTGYNRNLGHWYPSGTWFSWDNSMYNWSSSGLRYSPHSYVRNTGQTIIALWVEDEYATYNYDSRYPPNGAPGSYYSPDFVCNEIGEWTVSVWSSYARNMQKSGIGRVFRFNITLPNYDLNLSKVTGPVYINSWITATATCIDADHTKTVNPFWGGVINRTNNQSLTADYLKFKITYPDGHVVDSDKIPFANRTNSNSFDYQVTQPGKYLVSVWAYRSNDTNVPVRVFNTNSNSITSNSPNNVLSVSREEFYV